MNSKEFKEIRKNLGHTQEDLSLIIGVSKRTISRYETGKYDIPTPIINMMRSKDINNRIIVLSIIESYHLSMIVNSYDFVSFIDIECNLYSGISLFAATINDEELTIREYLPSKVDNSLDEYIDQGIAVTIIENDLTNEAIINAVRCFYPGENPTISISGIGFNEILS